MILVVGIEIRILLFKILVTSFKQEFQVVLKTTVYLKLNKMFDTLKFQTVQPLKKKKKCV